MIIFHPSGEIRTELFALPTGLADATAAIQTAIDAAADSYQGAGESAGYNSVTVTPTLRLQDGARYYVPGGLDLRDVRMVGNRSFLFSDNPDEPIISTPGYLGEIEGVWFGGGKNHIYLMGSGAADGCHTKITNCRFAQTTGGGYSTQIAAAGMAALIEFDRCTWDRCLAVAGSVDDLVITGGRAKWEVAAGAWLDVTTSLKLRDIQGVPVIAAPSENAWIRLDGNLICDGFRFGGESGGARILAYHGTRRAGVANVYARSISFQGCPFFCSPTAWGTFEGDMPSVSIDDCQGYAPIGATLDAAAEASLADTESAGLSVSIGSAAVNFANGINPYFARAADGTTIDSLSP